MVCALGATRVAQHAPRGRRTTRSTLDALGVVANRDLGEIETERRELGLVTRALVATEVLARLGADPELTPRDERHALGAAWLGLGRCCGGERAGGHHRSLL